MYNLEIRQREDLGQRLAYMKDVWVDKDKNILNSGFGPGNNLHFLDCS